MCCPALVAHNHCMFQHHQLTATINADRQTRLRNAATRQRLVRRNKVPPSDASNVFSVVWPDEADGAQRAHCAA
jgi:hypothetical protein